MQEMKIKLTKNQHDTLMYLTNGNHIVRASDMIKYYSEFLPEELREIAQDVDIIEFIEC